MNNILIEQPKSNLILPPHIVRAMEAKKRRTAELLLARATQKKTKHSLKEYLDGEPMKCGSCGVSAGTKTKLNDKYVGVTIRKLEDGYRCQLCK